MSCESFLPVSLTEAEAEGLSLPPWSANCPEWCEEHEESLSLFCLDDLEPLCKQCAAVSHEGHRVYLLNEAATDCKEELKTSLNGLKKRMIQFERVTQTCEHTSRHNQAEARLTAEQIKSEFESLHQFLREEEAARLVALREKQKEKTREAEEKIDRMNQMIKSLEERIQLTEEELDAGGDGVEMLERYQDTMSSTQTGGREQQKFCSPLIDVAKHLGNLQYDVWEKMKLIAPYTPVTLDPRTSGPFLRLSPGLNSVQINPGASQELEQDLDFDAPANPERFHHYSCILAREGFDSGVHCWDVEVGDTDNWIIGVAAQSVSRRTEFEACPEAGLWCISLQGGEYRALTAPPQAINIDDSHQLSRVRVRLDFEEGTLEFIDADAETHLFTLRHCFTVKMYPYFESEALCGSLAVLPQRVNVSVGSGYVSEDTDEDQMIKSESGTVGDINMASVHSNSTVSERGCLTENKNSGTCSGSKEKAAKPQRQAVKKMRPAGKEKTKDNRPAAKKQISNPTFSANYHISLSKALN